MAAHPSSSGTFPPRLHTHTRGRWLITRLRRFFRPLCPPSASVSVAVAVAHCMETHSSAPSRRHTRLFELTYVRTTDSSNRARWYSYTGLSERASVCRRRRCDVVFRRRKGSTTWLARFVDGMSAMAEISGPSSSGGADCGTSGQCWYEYEY